MSENVEILFFGIVIGMMLGAFLGVLDIGYQMYDKATKAETENGVVYTYSWEVVK